MRGDSLPTGGEEDRRDPPGLEPDFPRETARREEAEVSRIGRNDPCPCGSGMKYKKCCLGAQGPRRDPAREAAFDDSPQEPEILDPGGSRSVKRSGPTEPGHAFSHLSAYALAKMLDKPEMVRLAPMGVSRRLRGLWTPGKVAPLETEAIQGRLRAIGVDPSREAFLDLAADRISAWEVSNVWREGIGRRLGRDDDDFLGLGACELWKRFCPERPSVEMLDDGMGQGYEWSARNESEKACDRWWEVWETLRPRFRPETRATDQTLPVYRGSYFLGNWIQDFSIEIRPALSREARYARMGARFCREVLAQFPDEGDLFRANFRADMGEYLFAAGRAEEGEEALRALIGEMPHRAIGYLRLAEVHESSAEAGLDPEGKARARALLEGAIAYPVDDASDWDLEARLEELGPAGDSGT